MSQITVDQMSSFAVPPVAEPRPILRDTILLVEDDEALAHLFVLP